MSAMALGALATAGSLGATHALVPDHVAGISSLTGEYGDPRFSALVGLCFGAGHVALVIAWVVVAHAVLGRTSLPAVLDTVGTAAIVAALGVFGAVLAVRGYRAAADAHGHGHEDATSPHVYLPLVGTHHDHTHTTRAYLETGLVGALFTLSPPLLMIAFLGTILPARGLPVVGLAVGAYAAGIASTMAVIGAGVGGLFGVSSRRGRAHGVLRLVIGVAVLGLAVSIGAGVVPGAV